MKQLTLALLFLMTGILTTATAHAKTVTLFPLDATNIHEGHVEAATKVLTIYLQEHFSTVTVVTAAPPAGKAWTAAQAMAHTKNTDHFILGSFIRLGNRVKVALTMYATQGGAKVLNDTLDAGSPDDVDPVMKRLARSMGTGKKAARNAEISDVTEDESDSYRKREANNYFGLKVHGTAGFSEQLKKDTVIPGFGLYWLYDIRTLLLETEIAFMFGQETSSMFFLNLGAYYPFSRSNSTFFAGAGLGFHNVSYVAVDTAAYEDNDATQGLSAELGVGYLFGRQSSVHGKFDLRYFVQMFKIKENINHGLHFSVGIGF